MSRIPPLTYLNCHRQWVMRDRPQWWNDLLDLYEGGLYDADIAQALGCDKEAVRRVRRVLCLPSNRPRGRWPPRKGNR